jgi:hypothetical protein
MRDAILVQRCKTTQDSYERRKSNSSVCDDKVDRIVYVYKLSRGEQDVRKRVIL